MEQLIQTVESFGGRLVSRSNSSISLSQYAAFDGIPTQMPKSKRRAFFARFPKANGSGFHGLFTVRVSDHKEVSCREAAMFGFRTDREAAQQIDELRAMLAFLTGRE